MSAALNKYKLVFFNAINNAVIIINTSTPITLPISFQRFRVAYTLIGVTFDVSDKLVDFLQGFSVLSLPIEIIIPCVISP